MNMPIAYTPKQVAKTLQLSTATIYNLIDRGELSAKKYGKAYRIPQTELSFIETGLDFDLYQAQKQDLTNIKQIKKELTQTRKALAL